jgi:hypothetical protein
LYCIQSRGSWFGLIDPEDRESIAASKSIAALENRSQSGIPKHTGEHAGHMRPLEFSQARIDLTDVIRAPIPAFTLTAASRKASRFP